MVLASLGPTALSKFREWMLHHFGFEVYPQSVGDGARIALRMKEAGSDAEFNLADMGFGFSQMLPFLFQIWYVVERDSRRATGVYYGSPARRYPEQLHYCHRAAGTSPASCASIPTRRPIRLDGEA